MRETEFPLKTRPSRVRPAFGTSLGAGLGVAVLTGLSALGAWGSQDPLKPPEPPSAPAPAEACGSRFIDFARLEGTARVGMIAFSSDFDADPEFSLGIQLRAPLPWFSRDALRLEQDRLGAFWDLTFSRIERETSGLKDPDSNIAFTSLGLDYTFVRDETWLAQGQLGAQYGRFGDVSDVDDGFAVLLGALGGVRVGEGFRVTLSPQGGIGSDRVYFVHLGVQFEF